ncbi:MAG: LysR family transcriptional regulator [Bacillota bacterium]
MLDDLATFSTVVRCGSMSRAAAELHLSQPAVSQRLRALEEAYGMQLLRRTNRGVEVTSAGEVLNRYAHRLLALQETLQKEMDSLRSAEPRQVVIGATSTVGGYALPCTVYLFQQVHPNARIQLQIGNRAEILERLDDGVVDLALIEGTPLQPVEQPEGWQASVVSEEDLVLITPVTGPLSELPVYNLETLRRAPLIVRERGSGTREVVEKSFEEHGLRWSDLNVAMELSSMDAVKTSVASGHGVALISQWCIKVEARIGTIRVVPLEGVRFHSFWTLLCPATRRRTGLTRALIRTLRSPADRGFC